MVGTVGTRVNGTEVATSLTTPEAPDLHALFAVMAEHDVEACAMEVSSHALVMGRVDGVVFDVACFTNLGRDHLDFHADEEEYFAAKAVALHPGPGPARPGQHRRRARPPAGRRGRRSRSGPTRSATPRRTGGPTRSTCGPDGSTFTVHTPGRRELPAAVPLTGDFNVSNALCAIAALAELGFDPRRRGGGARAPAGGVPGRLERVDAGQEFLAVVDYAHKPDAVRGGPRRAPPGRPGAGSSSCSGPAATATPASGRSWARSPPGWPTSWS